MVAGNYFVSTTGNDANDGLTPATAWATIDNGDRLKVLVPGDLVLVQPGTYYPSDQHNTTGLQLDDEDVVFINCSGSSGSPITYKANGAVTINVTASGTEFGVRMSKGISNIVFDGFVVDANYITSIALETDSDGTSTPSIPPTSNVTVQNCTIKGALFNAAYRSVTNCSFHNNVTCNGMVLTGWGAGFYQDDWNARGNSGITVFNNTFDNLPHYGLEVEAGDSTNQYINNIFEGCTTGLAGASIGNVTHTNNMFWPASTAPSPLGTAETAQNPDLNADYTLQAGSPAIDAGVYVGLPYNGSAPDLGAFEFAGSQSSGTCSVTGTITCALNGSPISGASVAIGGIGALTASDGTYTISSAPYGEQPLSISMSGVPRYQYADFVTLNIGANVVNRAISPGLNYYVAPTGNDANSGLTPDTAWLTMSNGDAHIVQGGDTVHVAPGTYTYSTGATFAANGVVGYPITYLADPAAFGLTGPVVFKFTGDGDSGQTGLWLNSIQNVVVDGFTTQDAGSSPTTNHIACKLNNCTNVTVQHCNFSGTNWFWIPCYLSGNTDCMFRNNVVGPFPYNNCTGISVSYGGTRVKIYNNTCVDCQNAGIQLHNSTWSPDGGVTNYYWPLVNCEAKNNIVVGSAIVPLMGIDINHPSYATTTTLHCNNLVYNTSHDYFNTDTWTVLPMGPGEIDGQNPMLNANDTLQAGSPAIDTGCLVGMPFNGAAPDMGAFESAYAGPIPNNGPLGTVTGQVTDSISGSPLSGALVRVDSINTTYTDANGNYTMQSLTGSYLMRASYTLYGSVSRTVTITAGVQTQNFALTQAQAHTWYVSPTGDDGNDGYTSYSAWATIENGDKNLYIQPGDTIHVLRWNIHLYPFAATDDEWNRR